jgi:hypothetical protein
VIVLLVEFDSSVGRVSLSRGGSREVTIWMALLLLRVL